MDLFQSFAESAIHRRIDLRINEAETKARQIDGEMIALAAKVEALEEINAGLWALLKERLNLSDEDLVAATEKVEKAAKEARISPPCPSCGRRLLSLSSPNCSWCGEPIERLLNITRSV